MQRFNRILLTLSLVALSACARTPMPADTDTVAPAPGASTEVPPAESASQKGDWAAIEKLEGEARALASVAGCSAASECRTAAVGSRACGGPRYYLPYCAKTTDSAALFSKLDQVAKAEQAYNQKYQIVSTCEMRMPPEVTVAGGSCTAQ